jgi:MFS family permease
LLPVYVQRLGYSEQSAALLLIALAAGNVLLQIPLGMFSDRLSDRRYALYLCGVIGAIGTALIPFVVLNVYAFVAVLFVWGGVISGLYTIGLAHLGSRLKGTQLAEANSAFVLCYTIGMTLGPQLAGFAMDWSPPHGYIWTMFGFFMLYLTLCLFRGLTRKAVN